jgi:hypothetical protein
LYTPTIEQLEDRFPTELLQSSVPLVSAVLFRTPQGAALSPW